MINSKVRQKKIDSLRVLCSICASRYYNSSNYIIRRANKNQTIKESCQICQVRMGFDFIVHNNNL